jgi:hypothetical protein
VANTIKPKRSYTLSSVPSGLAAGELAVNASATPKVWIGNAGGTGNVLIASLSLSDMIGSTTNITEGTNLYYTDARARAAVSAGTGITYSSSTGVIAADAASANTASKLVIRDASGNFSAGTITASLTGTASTATNLAAGSGGTIPYQSAAGTTAMLANGTAGQLLQANGGTAAPTWVSTVSGLTVTGLKETKTAPAISSGTLTLNCSLGNVFAVSLNANITTLSFTNVPSTGTAFGLTLMLTADGTARTITWGSSVKWAGGTAPTLTSTNAKVDVFVLITHDGGTTWYAFTSGQNL